MVAPQQECREEIAISKVTLLDRQLYAWLAESDDRRFALAFNIYFSVAFPAVVRFLARISRWDTARLEELAQDALLKFFEKVGRDRRTAAQSVAAELKLIRPLPELDSFHAGQVKSWTESVSAFITAAMSFTLPGTGSAAESDWRSDVRALTERMRSIRRAGWQLLSSTLRKLGMRTHEDLARPSTDENITPGQGQDPFTEWMVEEDAAVVEPSEVLVDLAVREWVASLTHAVATGTRPEGTQSFVQNTLNIVKTVPRLRVPTNGYLFDIATTIYLDECKKYGRLKRGGTGLRQEAGISESDEAPFQSAHEIAMWESKAALDREDHFEEVIPTPVSENAATDPTLQYEHEEYLAKFYEYLYRPVSEAVQAFQDAVDSRQANIERQKLKSRADKFARTTSVLSLLGAGNTQEQTADLLGLSRNQVKYIVEVVQEAYERFASLPAPLSAPKRKTVDVQQ